VKDYLLPVSAIQHVIRVPIHQKTTSSWHTASPVRIPKGMPPIGPGLSGGVGTTVQRAI
jgi:hypothetical protein